MLHRIINGGAKISAAPGVSEGEILVHGDAEEVGEVGDGDGPVGPGAGAVDGVAFNHVRGVVRGNIVRVAAVSVVGQVIAKSDEGAKGIRSTVGWGWC